VGAGADDADLGGAEELLGQPQHQRLVLARHAQDRHDHPQREEVGHLGREVKWLAAERRDVIERFLGQCRDCGLELAYARPHEPLGGHAAVFAMVGIVHVGDRPVHAVVLAAGLAGCALGRRFLGARHQIEPAAVDEDVVLARHLHDVGVARQRPEGAVVGGLGPVDRRGPAQFREERMDARLVGVDGWRYHGLCQVGRDRFSSLGRGYGQGRSSDRSGAGYPGPYVYWSDQYRVNMEEGPV
jgi:hypothetical protein